jgi:hypothetical protein
MDRINFCQSFNATFITDIYLDFFRCHYITHHNILETTVSFFRLSAFQVCPDLPSSVFVSSQTYPLTSFQNYSSNAKAYYPFHAKLFPPHITLYVAITSVLFQAQFTREQWRSIDWSWWSRTFRKINIPLSHQSICSLLCLFSVGSSG